MKWPQTTLHARDRHALVGGLVVIATLIMGFRGVPAWRTWSADVRATAEEARAQALQVERVLATYPRALDTLEARTERLLSHAPALLVGESRAAAASVLVDVVNGIARDAVVRIDAVDVRHDSVSRALPRVALDVQATADIVGLASFLQRLDRGPTLLAIRRLRVRPERVDTPADQVETLRVRLTIEGVALVARDAGSRTP